jgi:hypothetical protein
MDTEVIPPWVSRLSWLLDDSVPIVGGRRVGVDGFLSLVPGVGDAAGFALGSAVILAGVRAGASVPTILRMLINALGETLVSMVPLIGPVVSFVWKANQRNLKIVEDELVDHEATTRTSLSVVMWTIALLLITLAVLVLGVALLVVALYRWFST